jgi:hypothetical protein
LAGIDDSQLAKNLKSGAGSLPVKMAAFLIQQGFEGEGFSTTGVPDAPQDSMCYNKDVNKKATQVGGQTSYV